MMLVLIIARQPSEGRAKSRLAMKSLASSLLRGYRGEH
jgi:hypothetical protein